MILPQEIFRRKPVWIAISEFYLDTELDQRDLQRIAIILKESGFSLSELKKINYEEVAPIVSPNLMSTAGVWSGFDAEWLGKEIVKNVNRGKSKSFFNRFYKIYIDWMTNRYWREIEKMLNVSKNNFHDRK